MGEPLLIHDYLAEQVCLLGLDNETDKLVRLLIKYVNEAGYLETTLGAIAHEHFCDKAKLEVALGIIQYCGFAGLGARDLQECLQLQVRFGSHLQEPLRLIISRHLVDVKENNIGFIVESTGLPLLAIEAAIRVLRRFTPRPGDLVKQYYKK